MADNMKLKIVAPERIFYEGDSSFLEFTTTEGDMGIYPNHIPLTAIIAPGILRIYEGDNVREAALHSGFVQILQDSVTILAESVEWPDEIDKNRAKEAEVRAKRRIDEESGIDLDRAELALKRALLRQRMARM
ncbi:MAG: ATP synthase F1 subunit epsilon [Lachnospiraceae bacterium]|nr:ATP synthase F1 subunit epsilon [Lachnospiraceae bacterium]